MAQQTTVRGFRGLSARGQMREQEQGAGPAPRPRLSLRPCQRPIFSPRDFLRGQHQRSQQEAGSAAR